MKDEKILEDLMSSVTDFVVKNQEKNPMDVIAIISVFVTVITLFYKSNGYSKEELLDNISQAVDMLWKTDNTTKS